MHFLTIRLKYAIDYEIINWIGKKLCFKINLILFTQTDYILYTKNTFEALIFNPVMRRILFTLKI